METGFRSTVYKKSSYTHPVRSLFPDLPGTTTDLPLDRKRAYASYPEKKTATQKRFNKKTAFIHILK